jgi:two-component system, OmpR family, phosphate regulon sensor histidine kinase PhoR
MIKRALGLLSCMGIGAAWGVARPSLPLALGGALVGALAWLALDIYRSQRVLRWLAQPDAAAPPRIGGLWGEALERHRKQVKKLEKQLLASEARLDEFLAAIQASPNGVVLLDDASRIEWSNLTAAQHLGFDPQRDVGQHVRNLVRHPAFVALMESGDFRQEVQIDGPGPRPTEPSKISVQIHPYGHKRRLMLTRDVTAVQRADTMRRDFVANVSHEIRTPLTVLSGFVETMMSLPLSEDERGRYLGLMSLQAQRMQTLVHDLLTLSRLEGSPAPGAGEWVEARGIAEQVVAEAHGLSAAIAQPVHLIELENGPTFQVAGVRSELLSAMSNLMSNAVRYTPPGGRIQAGWRLRDDGGCSFHVQDCGPGIAPEHIPRLTERFYRVDRSRSRETGGTGLGLAIVKHVAQRHGGLLDVSSKEGAGSTFTIVLPPSRVKPQVPD